MRAVSTAVPVHRITEGETREHFGEDGSRVAERYARLIDASRIKKRHVALPVETLLQIHGQARRSEEYARAALALCEATATAALRLAGIDGGAVDVIVPVSCTGFLMPSLDARLSGRLGIKPTARRVPISELGCSAGAASLGVASELLRGGAAQTALVLSAEICSLCMEHGRLSPSDVLGRILFGDGAAAAVVSTAADAANEGPQILASRSVLVPDSTDLLQTSFSDGGFRLELSPLLPALIQASLRTAVDHFLGDAGLAIADLDFFAIHPGGPKILEAVEQSLELREDALAPSWEILEEFGNMSSATIFFVLQRLQERRAPASGALGLAVAFGPGVTCEFLLLRWRRPFAVEDCQVIAADAETPPVTTPGRARRQRRGIDTNVRQPVG